MTNGGPEQLRFDPPGKGPWEVDGTHFPKAVTPISAEAISEGLPRGFAESTARYGLLLSHFRGRVVNGFWYQQPVAFGAPEGAMGPPPKFIFKLLTRLHPGMRRRIATGKAAFENRIWREDLKRWDDECKPASIKRHLELQRTDLTKLDDNAALQHLDVCRKNLEAMVYQHHVFTIPCCAPVGDFLAHVTEWTGKTAGEVLGALKGSSPVSMGVAAKELGQLGEAIRNDESAKSLLASQKPSGEILEALRAYEGEVGRLTREFVEIAGYRSVGYDVGDPYALELPDVIVGAVRAAVKGDFRAEGKKDHEAKIAALRESVPEQHRARFDELLAEARMINRLRDERGLYSDSWATGLARRAVLEVGRRLKEKGVIDSAELAVHGSYDELAGLLRGQKPVTLDELKKREHRRRTVTVADIPAFLRAVPAPPPPLEWLPEAAHRPMKAVGMVIGNLFGEPVKQITEKAVKGLPVSPGTYEGTARVVSGPDDFGRIQQGDVLVTRSTSPSFNVVLPLLGGIVTDRGGQLSHAAIVAREYGIPCVVGTTEGTKAVKDGARVRVDGNTGEVWLLG